MTTATPCLLLLMPTNWAAAMRSPSAPCRRQAGQEGLQITKKISVDTDFDLHGLMDDSTVYQLNALANGAGSDTLPGPFNSLESIWTNGFRIHQEGMPLISGFFQLRNASGQFAFPNEGLIFNRNTFDYNFNGALNPVLHIGRNTIAFNTGMQFTVRRDTESPVQMNQNLFRQFAYFSSNSFGNWLAVQAALFTSPDLFWSRISAPAKSGHASNSRSGGPGDARS